MEAVALELALTAGCNKGKQMAVGIGGRFFEKHGAGKGVLQTKFSPQMDGFGGAHVD